VNVTAKSKYAVRALVELAQHDQERPVPLVEIAESRGIPPKFLEQLFAQLRKEGILLSHRGVSGGFRFGRSPAAVTVLEVVSALDGPLGATVCTVSGSCVERASCSVGDMWLRAKLATEDVLAATTIQQLADQEAAKRASTRSASEV
jgi:Rrf2 family transcriptional regulator, iron-sulfur cluster assembly transcription factor